MSSKTKPFSTISPLSATSPLTPNQKKVLEFLENHMEKHGVPPTHAIIMKHFGWKSPGSVHDYLNYLQDKGFLSREWHAKSSLKILEPKNSIPLLGKVAAGRPLEHLKYGEKLDVPSRMVKGSGSFYTLEISGDSMINEGILDGDYVVIREAKTADNGQIVVAFVDQGATIKRFLKKKNHIELHSANPKYPPFLVKSHQDFRIEGVYCGLLRFN